MTRHSDRREEPQKAFKLSSRRHPDSRRRRMDRTTFMIILANSHYLRIAFMRIKFILYILLAGLILSFQPASAQSFSLDQIQNVKVSQLSDGQIIEAWKKIQELG